MTVYSIFMGHIVEILNYGDVKHISTNKKDECFCGEKKKKREIQRIEDYKDIKQIKELCEDCFNNYKLSLNNKKVILDPTVKCSFDDITNNRSNRCGKIISAYNARELKHPNSTNGSEPVCEDCYKKIRVSNKNSVNTNYKNAVPWLEKQSPSKINQKSD